MSVAARVATEMNIKLGAAVFSFRIIYRKSRKRERNRNRRETESNERSIETLYAVCTHDINLSIGYNQLIGITSRNTGCPNIFVDCLSLSLTERIDK